MDFPYQCFAISLSCSRFSGLPLRDQHIEEASFATLFPHPPVTRKSHVLRSLSFMLLTTSLSVPYTAKTFLEIFILSFSTIFLIDLEESYQANMFGGSGVLVVRWPVQILTDPRKATN